ncbi:hypothetical protein [Inquilinus limosus]|uniref:Uncharacterized protein n=1 Tax=Inquilinus limosus TaxID=171674 RepID=A0A211ZRD5_9PROT|nr:hypothetical protein [Inquilinus limosus]OWJ67825.1 hypothetical protein BWR60_07550 [Inquilinus limosus]
MAKTKAPAHPTPDQVTARLAAVEADLETAKSALADAIDAEIATGMTDSPDTIAARRRVAHMCQMVDELRAAVERAEARAEERAAADKAERDAARHAEAKTLIPEFLRLAGEVEYTRGANDDVMTEFIRHGRLILRTLPNPPHGASGALADLHARASANRVVSDRERHAKTFTGHVARNVAWWFGLATEDVQAMGAAVQAAPVADHVEQGH